MRVFAKRAYGVPPERAIGSGPEEGGRPPKGHGVLLRNAAVRTVNDRLLRSLMGNVYTMCMRSVTVPIRMSPEERRRLAAAAARAGLPLGTWLRSLGLSATRAPGRRRAAVIARLRGSISDEEAEAMREEVRKSRAERS